MQISTRFCIPYTILGDIQCRPELPKLIQQKLYSWNKPDSGQLRADVATHTDMFIQRNTVRTPKNGIWHEFSGTINLPPTKYVPRKLTSQKFGHAFFTKACKSKVRQRSCI